VSADRRTEEAIRREITTERAQLADALADLRESVNAKRRPAAVVGGALAAGLTTAVAVKVLRLIRR
jgi:hypothetical protein